MPHVTNVPLQRMYFCFTFGKFGLTVSRLLWERCQMIIGGVSMKMSAGILRAISRRGMIWLDNATYCLAVAPRIPVIFQIYP